MPICGSYTVLQFENLGNNKIILCNSGAKFFLQLGALDLTLRPSTMLMAHLNFNIWIWQPNPWSGPSFPDLRIWCCDGSCGCPAELTKVFWNVFGPLSDRVYLASAFVHRSAKKSKFIDCAKRSVINRQSSVKIIFNNFPAHFFYT